MTDIADDYVAISKIGSSRRKDWINRRFPDGAAPQWWFFIIRSCIASVDRSCRDGSEDLPEELELGRSLLDLGVDAHVFTPMRAVSFLASFALSVVRDGVDLSVIPNFATPDGVVERALEVGRLTPEQALTLADKRRIEIIEQPSSIYHGEDISLLTSRSRDEIDELGDLESMLESISQLVTQVQDEKLEHRILEWMNLLKRLEIGEDAAQKARQWLAEYQSPSKKLD